MPLTEEQVAAFRKDATAIVQYYFKSRLNGQVLWVRELYTAFDSYGDGYDAYRDRKATVAEASTFMAKVGVQHG